VTEFKQINEEVPGLTPDEALFPEAQAFRIGEHEVVVRALVIKDYRRIARRLGALAAEVALAHPGVALDKLNEHLDVLIPLAIDSIGGLFADVFGLEADYVDEHLTLEEASAIAAALLLANRLPVIRKNLQRALQAAKQHQIN